ncbi:MAG: ASCH domain-containing protein [Mycoplasmatota bacterium]
MTHELKLQERYYNYIKKGSKRIELRLNDEKRQQIKIGDKIKFFKESDLSKSFEVLVTGLLNYNSFDNLFNDFDIDILADKEMTKEELKSVLEKFYTKEKQDNYGVLGIKIELL